MLNPEESLQIYLPWAIYSAIFNYIFGYFIRAHRCTITLTFCGRLDNFASNSVSMSALYFPMFWMSRGPCGFGLSVLTAVLTSRLQECGTKGQFKEHTRVKQWAHSTCASVVCSIVDGVKRKPRAVNREHCWKKTCALSQAWQAERLFEHRCHFTSPWNVLYAATQHSSCRFAIERHISLSDPWYSTWRPALQLQTVI